MKHIIKLCFLLFINTAFAQVMDTGDKVGIGTTSPSTKLHVQAGDTNFSWTPIAGTTGIFENTNLDRSFVSIIGKSNGLSELWFGDESSQNSGRVRYNHSANALSLWNGHIERVTLTENGSLGIGTIDPNDKLHVNGNTTLNIYHGTTQGHLNFRQGQPVTDVAIVTAQHGLATYNGLRINGTNGVSIGTNNGVERLRVTSSGNVGIGTTDTKGFKLGVQGKIAAEEVKVAVYANWADFVFNKDYNLPTLKDVEQHIKDKGHLKDIPSAEAVKKNGIFLGEMDAKLLQKIEELTLYTIQQQKLIELQEEVLKTQAKAIQELQEKIK